MTFHSKVSYRFIDGLSLLEVSQRQGLLKILEHPQMDTLISTDLDLWRDHVTLPWQPLHPKKFVHCTFYFNNKHKTVEFSGFKTLKYVQELTNTFYSS